MKPASQVIVTTVVTRYPRDYDNGKQLTQVVVAIAHEPQGDLFAAAQAEQIATDLERVFRNRFGGEHVTVHVE